ncbi:unnamed protein product [Euphydryas editha]|uniref:Uncharacterized protein n=1 Tax=Euphydryas editha TaxID=104508 RepID=A0AAU9TGI8_EUPED|nr:unnamed protein product [Euphydryas editha]
MDNTLNKETGSSTCVILKNIDRNENVTLTMETASTSEERTYNTTRRGRSRAERNTRKTRRNTGKSYITKKGKVVPDRKLIELSSCRLKCAERITTLHQYYALPRDLCI